MWRTREPTKLTESGRNIATAIRERNVSGEEAAQLFVNDRIEHTRDYILPSLARGDFVLCDRYDISTLGYQLTQGVDFKTLYDMHKYGEENGTLIPDLTLVFELPAKVAMQRIGDRKGVKEQFETLPFQEELAEKQNYVLEQLAELQPYREIIRINANQSPDAVTKEMYTKIINRFK